jgi:ABC-type multidrug transport system fused ATPase/permease subunit
MNEVMQGIRVIKYFAWEESFLQKIQEIRLAEVATLKKGSYIRAATAFIWTGTPLLVSIATFATYTLAGNDLTAEAAFTALALFNILRFPINMLPNVITGLVESNVAIGRLETFLSSNELDPDAVRRESSSRGDNAVEIDDAEFAWLKSDDDRDSPSALSNISLNIKHGELVCIIGPVGCGKSTLLQALLGEVPKRKGVVTVDGTIAYCPQQAWIQNATLKDNVLFGLPFDSAKYQRAVEVCQLQPDIAMLPAGDATEIGEKGINLSGGQKQRCSLARAVYQNSDIYLLDDPLSAVDAHVGKAIFEHCITGALAGKTRVLVTHQLQYLPYCDRVVVVKNGQIAEIVRVTLPSSQHTDG